MTDFHCLCVAFELSQIEAIADVDRVHGSRIFLAGFRRTHVVRPRRDLNHVSNTALCYVLLLRFVTYC